MIAFVSLFLQLVTGTHPVELAVSGPVAAVAPGGRLVADRERSVRSLR